MFWDEIQQTISHSMQKNRDFTFNDKITFVLHTMAIIQQLN